MPTPAPGFEPRDRGRETKERADDSCRTSFPPTFPSSKDFCNHVRTESANGETRAELKLKYATAPGLGCWVCRFKPTDTNFHTDANCKLLNTFYPYNLSCRMSVPSPLPPTPIAIQNTTHACVEYNCRWSHCTDCQNSGKVLATLVQLLSQLWT